MQAVYDSFDYQEFQKVIEWGSDKKFGTVDVYIDIQKLRKLYPDDSDESELSKTSLSIIQTLSKNFENIEKVEEVIAAFSLALSSIRFKKLKKTKRYINCQFYNFDKFTPFSEINVIHRVPSALPGASRQLHPSPCRARQPPPDQPAADGALTY